MEALVKKDLDEIGCPCGEGKNEPHALHAQCHISAPLWPWYFGGLLRLECSECHATVAIIKVAKA